MSFRRTFTGLLSQAFRPYSLPPRRPGRRHDRQRLRGESLESRRALAVLFDSATQFDGASAGDVAVDGLGNTFILGSAENTTIDLDPNVTHADNADLVTAVGADAFVAKYAADGAFLWARTIDSDAESESQVLAPALATDAVGNVYVGGSFTGTAKFGSLTLNTSGLTQYDYDLFATSIDSDGAFRWVQPLGASQTSDLAFDLTVDSTGQQVYIAGQRLVLAPDNKAPSQRYSIFLAEIDARNPSQVSTAWAHTLIGSLHGGANSLTLDPTGNVYVAGSFRGQTDFDPGPRSAVLTSGGGTQDGRSAFIWKSDSNGNYLWAKNFQAPSRNGGVTGLAIAAALDGSVIVAGGYTGKIDFDPGKATVNLAASTGQTDAYITKLSSTGSLVWARSFNGAGYEYVSKLVFDANNNIYAAGQFETGADFDPGSGVAARTGGGAFVVKLNANGNFQWVALAKPLSHEQLALAGLAIYSSTGAVKLVGSFGGILNTDPDPDALNPELFTAGTAVFCLEIDPD